MPADKFVAFPYDLIQNLLRTYERGLRDDGPFPKDTELAAMSLLWIAAYHPHAFDCAIKQQIYSLRRHYSDEKQIGRGAIFRRYPIDCVLFLLEEDYIYTPCANTQTLFQSTDRKLLINEVTQNLCHHSSSIRHFTMECFYFVAPHVPFDNFDFVNSLAVNFQSRQGIFSRHLYLYHRMLGGITIKSWWLKHFIQHEYNELMDYEDVREHTNHWCYFRG